MTLKEMLESPEFQKKNATYNKSETKNYLENYSQTVLNMRTVKEGTGHAGGFAIWIAEVGSIIGLNPKQTRNIANLFQREALDAKHSSGKGGYKNSIWYKFCDKRYKTNFHASEKDILEELIRINNGSTPKVPQAMIDDEDDMVTEDDLCNL
jgi:hypothetical protein